jgi:uncharacterized OB-fold protein
MAKTDQNKGWTCPRCGMIHSPKVKTCKCGLKNESTNEGQGPQLLTE